MLTSARSCFRLKLFRSLRSARDERWLVYDVQVGGMSFVSSYRSQFDRVIRTEGYGALRGRLQKKSLDTALAERRPEGL